MTDFVDDATTEEWAEFEQLGRRAGAELRTPPPEEGIPDLQRAVRRRATTRVVAGCVAFLVLVGGAWVVLQGRGGDESPVDQTPVTTVPLPAGVPGTWRELTAPQDAPDAVLSSTWTGSDVVVLGARDVDVPVATAHAYDVRRDVWRQLATPPAAALSVASAAWTGSTLVAADRAGHVFLYDPAQDRWAAGASTAADVAWTVGSSLVSATSGGVLARSDTGWWWYDARSDAWSTVPAPDPRFEGSRLAGDDAVWLDVLAPTSFVVATYDGTSVVTAMFDTVSRRWTDPREMSAPPVTRESPVCQAAGGRLVCWAEGFSTLDGVVIDMTTGDSAPFTLDHDGSLLATTGTPWFGHARSLLLARTATWEALPTLQGTEGFSNAIWDGEELIMVGGQNFEGAPSRFAAAYTPVVQP